ncbi:probable dolichyl pyrophosphate Man9GlcNAc2 alpha-1,3-glucosyltransferase [Aphidius gifuensis]|uniref:probable dolichyl pyrophosphate Man9GlcNAc2 alpha-1,3-glucosyltransferase n=1 Tax=Aphidius gifuensis TaxID=684658 RepID=UPI001CDCDDCE|nr:probable dolichyl pyrophosphate Man9GlcNAc2 alpha-1,3-glucosyltransferase [Aphidius gifuensis]
MSELRIISICIGIALLLRWSISYHPYSGYGKPPMYGDYEAQRHWQEITINLPLDNWYKNSTNNDLQYWGLDYPPLTAYHSLIIGKIAGLIDNSYIELTKSRGIESDNHKNFMRLTVLFSDLIIYLPAVLLFFIDKLKYSSTNNSNDDNSIFNLSKFNSLLLTFLIYPGIIIIDYGHFQYNCVSLGLFILSVKFIANNCYSIGSLFFVFALNYKQMELYHALPIFFYILGICKKQKNLFNSLKILSSVGLTVLATFALIWSPFIYKWPSCIDVLIRLFPFGRGVFEDKVANIWCAINVVVKLKNLFDHMQLAKICLAATVITSLPSCLNIFLKPNKDNLILSLINVSLSFYLFSFQVHEKSILLVAIPVLLYFHNDPLACFWFLIVSVFSMLPLLIKDQLFIAYCSLMVFYFLSICTIWKNTLFNVKFISIICNFHASILTMIILTISSVTLKPPKKYPDLFPLLISVYSCIHFCLFFLYFNCKQLENNKYCQDNIC